MRLEDLICTVHTIGRDCHTAACDQSVIQPWRRHNVFFVPGSPARGFPKPSAAIFLACFGFLARTRIGPNQRLNAQALSDAAVAMGESFQIGILGKLQEI
jgi:hypothetical protein